MRENEILENLMIPITPKTYGLKIYQNFWGKDMDIYPKFEKLYCDIFSRLFENSILLNRRIIWVISILIDCVHKFISKKDVFYWMCMFFLVTKDFDNKIEIWNRLIESGGVIENF